MNENDLWPKYLERLTAAYGPNLTKRVESQGVPDLLVVSAKKVFFVEAKLVKALSTDETGSRAILRPKWREGQFSAFAAFNNVYFSPDPHTVRLLLGYEPLNIAKEIALTKEISLKDFLNYDAEIAFSIK